MEVLCTVCDASLPCEAAREAHDRGKKHQKALEDKKRLEDLGKRSIFVRDVPDFAQKPVKTALEAFGMVERVIPSKKAADSGVVVFTTEEGAQAAIEAGQKEIGSIMAKIAPRKMDFASPKKEQTKKPDLTDVFSVIKKGDGYEEQIERIFQRYGLQEKEVIRRREAVAKLEQRIREYFNGEPVLVLFGSTITGIGMRNGDVDVTLTFKKSVEELLEDAKEAGTDLRDKATLLASVPAAFRGRRIDPAELGQLTKSERLQIMTRVMNEIRKDREPLSGLAPIHNARTPLLRFSYDSIDFDFTVDNDISASKSRWLREQILVNPSLIQKFLFGIRIWALSNELLDNGQSRGHFNSYMLNLMALHFMVMKAYLKAPEEGQEPMALYRLFREFFSWGVLTKHSDLVHTSGVSYDSLHAGKALGFDPKWDVLNVMDPIDLTHNVTMTVTPQYVSLLKQKMCFSLAKMKKQKTNFAEILSIPGQAAPSPKRKASPSTKHV